MAKKDYVNRRPTTKKKKKGTKSRNKVNSSRLWLYLVFILIIIIGIVGWMKFHTTTNQRTEVIPAKPEHSKVELPSRPEIEWSYIKQLETREVPINNTQTVSKNAQLTKEQQKILQQLARDGGKAFQPEKKTNNVTNNQNNIRYGLQCGAFKNKEQAESLQAQLAFNGLVSKVKSSANWYRVFAGPYDSKTQAENKQAQVKNLTNCVIVGM